VGVGLVVAVCAPLTFVFFYALTLSVPPQLLAPPPGASDAEKGPRRTSLRVLDREGGVLATVHDGAGDEAGWLRAREAPLLENAMIAAEDRRFRLHAGIDVPATLRSAAHMLYARRVVSGASTLTQQLARLATGAPRNLRGKVFVLGLAVRLELAMTKDEILEQYLNRAPFGARVRGVEAASRRYFDKPAKDLSLAEAATLAAIPQSPSRLDPRREAGRARLLRRRDEILGRIEGSGFATPDEVRRARAEPLTLAPGFGGTGAPHLARAILSGKVDTCARRPVPLATDGVSAIRTTIDPAIQAVAIEASRRTLAAIEDRHVTSASVVVLDNQSREILAWVGSPGQDDTRLGHNDGVLARRQPGSTLKPFVYGLAMERLGFSPATLLPDVELSFPAKEGEYRPHNYDGTFHGPVLLREALGNSYNVPAVWTTQRLGAGSVLRRLRDLGMCSMDRTAEHYGLAIALGDAETTLIELASAYATLASRGDFAKPRAIVEIVRWDGGSTSPPIEPARRVLARDASELVLDVLADPGARVDSFGERNVLDLPFPFAAKTGTSKGFRDNLAIGVTPAFTVAVWVGNMDGSPMRGVSGVTGAGPLLREVALGVSRTRDTHAFEVAAGDLEEVEVCAISGRRASPVCAHRRKERVLASRSDALACDVHVEVSVDRDGALAAPSCAFEKRVVERWRPPLAAWARAAGRSGPLRASTSCPPERGSDEERLFASVDAPLVSFPADGDRFHIDPGSASPSAVIVEVQGHDSVAVVDGVELPTQGGRAKWVLSRGIHRIVARSGRVESPPVEVSVD
jgi:penicillin-binding protein 1C